MAGMTVRLAVPTTGEAGLDAQRSRHFGHCDCFTIVDIDDGEVKGVEGVACPEHVEGGCLRPVDVLSAAGVTAVAVYGMGARPFAGFMEAGIAVLHDATAPTVGGVARLVATGRVAPMTLEQACNHHH